MSEREISDFLKRHGLDARRLDIGRCAEDMAEHMRAGLRGEVRSMPMIPTYLSCDGRVEPGSTAVVIDAGGTNFRSALVRFNAGSYEVSELQRAKMPGIEAPCTWEEFIKFTADRIEPLMDRADCIGFCFSYEAEITPELDGRVRRIDKEVVITGCEGRLIGASLIAELGRRGISGKRVVILNDTAAVLLGGSAVIDKSAYGALIGQVSGTGTNTCVSLPRRKIPKLGPGDGRGMIINLEAGLYDGIRGGDLDAQLDRESNNPGSKIFEKLTAGAYLGELCVLALKCAAEEGLFGVGGAEKLAELGKLDGSNVDAWASGERLAELGSDAGDRELAQAVCRALLLRSARCMCINLLALGILIGEDCAGKPICVCAEGSLVQRSETYRDELRFLLAEQGARRGLSYELKISDGATMPGSAAAALLN